MRIIYRIRRSLAARATTSYAHRRHGALVHLVHNLYITDYLSIRIEWRMLHVYFRSHASTAEHSLPFTPFLPLSLPRFAPFSPPSLRLPLLSERSILTSRFDGGAIHSFRFRWSANIRLSTILDYRRRIVNVTARGRAARIVAKS